MIHSHWLSLPKMIHNLWHSITIDDSQPLAHHITPCFTTTGSALRNMNNNHWLSIAHHNSKPLAQNIKP
jgi:hypothetical protein